ncbi:hypothetical protein Tco_1319257 [Tanacetum coccineum]
MDNTRAQQKALDDELVALADRLKIGKSNIRLSLILKSKKPTLQVALDALKLTPFYNAFEISADVPEIYMQEFWIFEEPPLEEEIISFIRDLGHNGEIKFLSDVNVIHMHQPWRSFVAIINKCLSGKTTTLESLRLSRAQIICGMYHNKTVDYIYLLWEDLVYQVENKNSKKNNDIYYPRFTKVIVEYFMAKDQGIPRRNKMFWHYARDDFMFTIKQSASKSKGLTVLSKVALTEAQQMKIAIERSKIQTHSSHASGLGDGVNIQSKVPDEHQGKDDEDNDEHDSENNNDDEDDDLENIEEVHVTLTTEPPVVQQQSSSVSSYLVSKFINPSPDTSIDSILNPNVQSDIHVNVSVPATIEIPSSDTTIPQPPIPIIQSQQQTHDTTTTTMPEIPTLHLYLLKSNKLKEEAQAENDKFLKQIDSNIKAIIKDQVKAQVSKIIPKVEKYVTESLGAEVLARSSNQPQTSYAAATSLSEFELKKILINKFEENNSMNRSDIQKNLYTTLIESYNSDKDLFALYGDVVTQKRGRDDQDKDEEPSAGSNRGTKRNRSGKEESSKEATQKESKSTSSSKGASRSQQNHQASLLKQRNMVQGLMIWKNH